MISNIHNENYGYAVACEGPWAAVGNPSLLTFNPATGSLKRTGSVEVYGYNGITDVHDLKTTLNRPISPEEKVLLRVDTASLAELILHTEPTGSVAYTANLDLEVDVSLYFTASEDYYGKSLDIFNNILMVGNPYFSSSILADTSSFTYTGSGNVDLYDLTRLNINPYLVREQPTITGIQVTASHVVVTANVPASQSFGYVLLESSVSGSDYQRINLVSTTNAGGIVLLNTNYPTTSSFLNFRVTGIVSTNPYLATINNPNPVVTMSFGHDVSLNESWLAISSIYESSSLGSVFMYQRLGGIEASWSLYQTIRPPSDIVSGSYFGWSLDLNKATGSFSGSMVVGSYKTTGSKAYVYEFVNGLWSLTHTLSPSHEPQELTFFPTQPYFSSSALNFADRFGYDVAIYGNTVVVGAPRDRIIYEYTGSSLYHQGAVYFFEKCSDTSQRCYLARKSYGNEKILKDNSLGISVSVKNGFAVAGSPKFYLTSSLCYLRGTLYQQHYCGNPDEAINGQFVLYNKTTGSIPDSSGVDWEVTNVYQIKKRMLQPHRAYGFSTDISDDFIIIGAPMLISGSNRVMDFSPNTASFTGSVDDVGDLSGKAYIYNLNNFREEFYVGNVFYRNGKIVIMSSGSSFEGILQESLDEDLHEYDMDFKSKQVIFEKQIVCPIEPGEFNVSTNPTATLISRSLYDLNRNGQFDFQDVDVILRFMRYKNTEVFGIPNTDWSSSIINTNTDEEITVYNMYSASWAGTDALFTQSFSLLNSSTFSDLDFNEDNKIDENDMNILWKYFIYRLTQKNYETYVTSNSEKKYLSDIINFLNARTLRGHVPQIEPEFLNYSANSKTDPTGSYLAPYVTTVGLYNGCDLVAVAKLGSPIKITPDFPINIVVKMDF